MTYNKKQLVLFAVYLLGFAFIVALFGVRGRIPTTDTVRLAILMGWGGLLSVLYYLQYRREKKKDDI